MGNPQILETTRLRLRPFRESDLDALARLNADPQVMRYLGRGTTLDHAATWRQIALFFGHAELRGYTILAIEDRASGALLGRSGPWYPEGWPMLEVGWVVDPRRQGQGIATEAGRVSLDWCFAHLGAEQVCSLIAPDNSASARVATKLGATVERRITVFGQPADLWIHRRPAELAAAKPILAASHDASPAAVIETPRLRLRPFQDSDLDNLARLYANADVMRYIGDGKTLDRPNTWRQIATFRGHQQLRGFSTWAIEDRASGQFVGECGPWFPEGWPMLEVGWLIDPTWQRQGLATEAGRAWLDWSFQNLGVEQICSIIAPANEASARVAAKLGARIERRITVFGQAQDLWMHRRPGAAAV
jgi:RimJ/RimL family protein N-acetyltransferase